jgi:hypothetical protein
MEQMLLLGFRQQSLRMFQEICSADCPMAWYDNASGWISCKHSANG